MTAFAGVPCRCGQPQGSSTHDERLKDVQHYHPYQPDRRSLEAVAVELTAACEAAMAWAAGYPLGGGNADQRAADYVYGLARAALAAARAIGIKPPEEAGNG